MRIAAWHNLPSGGGKRAFADHLRGLVERGHHVEVWSPPTADRDYLPTSHLAADHVVDLDFSEPLLLRGLARARLRGRVHRRLRAFDAHAEAVGHAIGNRFDVVFANSSRFFRATSLAQHTSLPTLLYLQEPHRALWEASAGPPAWLVGDRRARNEARARAVHETAAVQAFDRVLVNSRYSRESVLRAYGSSAHVCYLGVDTEHFTPTPDPVGDHLVGVGAFVPEKNIAFVLRALAELDQDRPPLVWVGNASAPAHLDELTQLASTLGVVFEPRLRLRDDELIDILRGARAMVYAPRLEPFGYAPLEAAACGTPTVAVAEGGVRETVVDGETGRLTDADPVAFAEAIDELLQEPAEARRMGRAARSRVERSWSTDAATDRLERHLADVAGGAHR